MHLCSWAAQLTWLELQPIQCKVGSLNQEAFLNLGHSKVADNSQASWSHHKFLDSFIAMLRTLAELPVFCDNVEELRILISQSSYSVPVDIGS